MHSFFSIFNIRNNFALNEVKFCLEFLNYFDGEHTVINFCFILIYVGHYNSLYNIIIQNFIIYIIKYSKIFISL